MVKAPKLITCMSCVEKCEHAALDDYVCVDCDGGRFVAVGSDVHAQQLKLARKQARKAVSA